MSQSIAGMDRLIAGMSRFVVLRHETPPEGGRPSHWDFMLEDGQRLRTFALSAPPEGDGAAQDAELLGDHRLEYLNYEGPISRDRGAVTRWDRGTCRIDAANEDALIATVVGEKLRGRVTFERVAGSPQRWRFRFEAEPATSG